uniref:Periplasmic binding protein n=1 Tax=Cyanothece sp. (strain PCC 7425 / ATCC 29141) TaxID=395961 RepID=B8HX76_CYAP4
MSRKFSWQYIKLFLVGLLIVVCLQSCQDVFQQSIQIQRSAVLASECRTVRHELGESCIPYRPQRVVVMDQESLEILVALGFKPIAATTANRVGNKAPILQNRVDFTEIVDLGKEGNPNLEKIVQLKPDLILGMFINPQIYPLLSQIAPTASIEYSQTNWKKTLLLFADMLDQRPKASELLSAFQQRIELIQARLAEQTSKLKISAMRFYTDASLTQFLNQNSFTINVLEELKTISIPEKQRQEIQVPNSDWGYVNVSLERIDLLDADAMFVALDPGSEDSFKLYVTSPLWQTLDVVQQKRVYTVDSGYWIFGNILSANAILDDLCKYLDQEKS